MRTELESLRHGSNAALLAVLIAVPVLAIAWRAGPIRGELLDAEAEHAALTDSMADVDRALLDLPALEGAALERARSRLARVRAITFSLGEQPGARLVMQVARLLEEQGAARVRVSPLAGESDASDDPDLEDPAAERPPPLLELDGTSPAELVPHPIRVRYEGDFESVQRTLRRLGDRDVPVHVESLVVRRNGAQLHTDLQGVYWSREPAPEADLGGGGPEAALP